MLDVFEILGAVAILAAFTAAQLGKLNPTSLVYLVLNLAGSATLAGIAGYDRSWGFLLLEGVWAVVSLVGLAAVLRRRAAPTDSDDPAAASEATAAAATSEDGAPAAREAGAAG